LLAPGLRHVVIDTGVLIDSLGDQSQTVGCLEGIDVPIADSTQVGRRHPGNPQPATFPNVDRSFGSVRRPLTQHWA